MRTRRNGWTIALAGLVLLLLMVPAAWAHRGGAREQSPLVIGHRGAAGYLPDHTLEGYALAIKLGADYIEPDLVSTKDGHLIARHEPNIITTTDVASTPSSRTASARRWSTAWPRRAGSPPTSRSPRSRPCARSSRSPERPQQFNGRFRIPTFEEVIALVKRKSQALPPPDRHLSRDQAPDLPQEHRAAAGAPAREDARRGRARTTAAHRCSSSSFEQSNLQAAQPDDAGAAGPAGRRQRHQPGRHARLHGAVRPPLRLDRLGQPKLPARTFGFFTTDAGLEEIATYADGIGPWKRVHRQLPRRRLNGDGTVGDANGDGLVNEADRKLLPPTDLVERAHEHGLLVHTWTFRNEQHRLAQRLRRQPGQRVPAFYRLGVDGLFSDFADTAFAARELFRLEEDPPAN